MVVAKKVQVWQMVSYRQPRAWGLVQWPFSQEPGIGLLSEGAHVGAFGVGWQWRWGVESLDPVGNVEVFVRYGAIGDLGVGEGHRRGLVSEERGDGFQVHDSVYW